MTVDIYKARRYHLAPDIEDFGLRSVQVRLYGENLVSFYQKIGFQGTGSGAVIHKAAL
jgi:hypothetical protein